MDERTALRRLRAAGISGVTIRRTISQVSINRGQELWRLDWTHYPDLDCLSIRPTLTEAVRVAIERYGSAPSVYKPQTGEDSDG